MSNFKEFMRYRVLDFKYGLQNQEVAEHLIANGQGPQLRNVCAKLAPELAEQIDNTVSMLGISKRLFIERALIEALDQVEAIVAEHKVWEDLEERSERASKSAEDDKA